MSKNSNFSDTATSRYSLALFELAEENNYIQEIPSAISQMLNLREVKFNNNQLSSMPSEIFNLVHLALQCLAFFCMTLCMDW